jgi:hypothetical protein
LPLLLLLLISSSSSDSIPSKLICGSVFFLVYGYDWFFQCTESGVYRFHFKSWGRGGDLLPLIRGYQLLVLLLLLLPKG